MKNFLILTVAIFTSSLLLAQENVETSEVQIGETSKPFSIMIDGASIISNGFGAKATYDINEYLGIGIMGGIVKYKPSESDEKYLIYKYDYTHRINEGALVADGFLPMANPRSKFYLSLGVRYAELSTEVNDAFYGTTNESSSSRTGGIITAGWQYAETLPFLEKAGIVFQVGLGFGNAGRVRWNYSGTKTEIQDGMLIDLKAGVKF